MQKFMYVNTKIYMFFVKKFGNMGKKCYLCRKFREKHS